MRILTKRSFISTVLGNVDENKEMTVADAYGKHLIENGLAVKVAEAAKPSDDAGKPMEGFQSPVNKTPERGSSLPAGQASTPKTVKRSSGGGKRKASKKGVSQ